MLLNNGRSSVCAEHYDLTVNVTCDLLDIIYHYNVLLHISPIFPPNKFIQSWVMVLKTEEDQLNRKA